MKKSEKAVQKVARKARSVFDFAVMATLAIYGMAFLLEVSKLSA